MGPAGRRRGLLHPSGRLLRVTLAAACEARAWRRRVRGLRWGLHGLTGYAHPDAHEQRRDRVSAALRHALASTLQHLGLGGLEEPTRESAVGRIAGELLEPRVVIVVEVDVDVAKPGQGDAVIGQLVVGSFE